MCVGLQLPLSCSMVIMNSLKSLQLPSIALGSSIEFVDPEPSYVCINCEIHFYQPYQLQCGHRICSDCYLYLSKSSKYPCPSGDSECVESEVSDVRPDYSVLKELSQKQVYCPNQNVGCDKKPLLKNLKNHLDGECLFVIVECPHSCGVSVIRRDRLDEHEKICPKRPHYCSFRDLGCHFKGSLEDLKNHMENQSFHLDHAALKLKEIEVENARFLRIYEELSNKYSDMGKIVSNSVMEISHKLEEASQLISNINLRENEILSCWDWYKSVDMEYRRQDVKKEVQKQNQLLELHQKEIQTLELRMQCIDTTNYNGILVWKVNEFSKRLKDAKEGRTLSLYSQPFHTNRYGYKMCARVYLNGDGIGKGNYISLFFVIMKGEYDDILQWPFKKKVTLMLLDQKNMSKDITDSFIPDPQSTSFMKPSSAMNIASGSPKFISHADLQKNDNYLKNDILFFKVVVSDI